MQVYRIFKLNIHLTKYTSPVRLVLQRSCATCRREDNALAANFAATNCPALIYITSQFSLLYLNNTFFYITALPNFYVVYSNLGEHRFRKALF